MKLKRFENFKINENTTTTIDIKNEVVDGLVDYFGYSKELAESKVNDYKHVVNKFAETLDSDYDHSEIYEIIDEINDYGYSVEYRDMHTAIHNVINVELLEDAKEILTMLDGSEDEHFNWDSITIDYDVNEIDYRQIIEIDGEKYISDEGNMIINHSVPDIY